MFKIALFQPEIPPNTGNIIRLCANVGAELHLIKPLGFELDNARLQRAGLDYHEWATIKLHENFNEFCKAADSARIIACSTKGSLIYTSIHYQPNDILLFGPETRGLPSEILDSSKIDSVIKIPMQPNNRSLNLSNAASVILYEAWRQYNFKL